MIALYNTGSEKTSVSWTRGYEKTRQQISSRSLWMDHERGRSQGNLDYK